MWFKVDDRLHSHPKTLAAGNEAMGVWVRLGSWACGHLTDGKVTKQVLEHFDPNGNATSELLRTGWLETLDLDSVYSHKLHDFLDWNMSRKQKESLSKKRAKAGSKGGSKREAKPEQSEPSLLSKSDAKGTGTGTGTGSNKEGLKEGPEVEVWERFKELRKKRYPQSRSLQASPARLGMIRQRLKDYGVERVSAALTKFFDQRFHWAKCDDAKNPELLFRSVTQFEKVENASAWDAPPGRQKVNIQQDSRTVQQALLETVYVEKTDDERP